MVVSQQDCEAVVEDPIVMAATTTSLLKLAMVVTIEVKAELTPQTAFEFT